MKLKKTRPFQWRTGKHRRLSENGYFSSCYQRDVRLKFYPAFWRDSKYFYAFLWL